MRYLFAFIVTFFPALAFASGGWYIRNVEVVAVEGSWRDGGNHMLLYFRSNPAETDTASINCAPTWDVGTASGDIKVVGWKSSNTPNSADIIKLNLALSAYAQNINVDLFLKDGTCDSSFGKRWEGVRITISE